MKGYRNYFDEIKNHKVEDKFIEHLIRLIFFTIVLSIEAALGKIKILYGHLSNFFKSRTMSHVLKKYSLYKKSIHHLTVKAPHEVLRAIEENFSSYERKVIFGLKSAEKKYIRHKAEDF